MKETLKKIENLWNTSKCCYYQFYSKGELTKLGNTINDLIEKYGDEDVYAFYEYMSSKPEKDLYKISNELMYQMFKDTQNVKVVEEVKEDAPKTDNILGALSNEIIGLMGKELANKISNEVEGKINEFIEGKVLTKVVEYNGEKKKVDGIAHKMFEPLLKFVAMDEPVMLVGSAGTGKNVLAKQVADALGLEFYFTSAVTQEYKLTGYGDAVGNYVSTQFYEAFTKGGVFLFDEVDASSPEAIVVVNSAIANRYFDFPVVGRVEAHKDFRIIACANTYGTGASMEYVGRNQLDGATLNRFAMLEVDYDKRIEDGVCPDKDIAEFCRNFRKICNKNGVHHIVSYREMSRMYKMIVTAGLEKEIAIRSCLTKGLEKDTLNMILCDMKDTLSYKAVFESMINHI